jgi:putative hydrolase of the HAD superfamily
MMVQAERDVDALIVDFGGVLTTPLYEAMGAFAADVGIELQDLARAALGVYAGEETDDLVTGFETGLIPEAEFAAEFSKRIADITGVTIPPEGLVRRLFGGLRLEQEMLDAVRAARGAGFKTGLLSNSWGVDYYPTSVIEELFDVSVISGEVGLRKPDARIFQLALQRLGAEAGRSVFVDDHPGHLKAATEIGMITVLHRSPTETIDELEALLKTALR